MFVLYTVIIDQRVRVTRVSGYQAPCVRVCPIEGHEAQQSLHSPLHFMQLRFRGTLPPPPNDL